MPRTRPRRFVIVTAAALTALAAIHAGPLALAQAPLYEVIGAHDFEATTGGLQLAALGDVNGDGVGDFASGAHADSAGGPAAGRVTVFSGADGTAILDVYGSGVERLGHSVAAAGDVDGDGFNDVVAGAPGFDGEEVACGAARVFSATTGALLASYAGVDGDDHHGSVVAGGKDFDGDGVADQLVAGEFHTTVYSGQHGAVLHDLIPTFGPGVVLRLVGLSDFDGDGRDDFALARPNVWVRVHSGADATLAHQVTASENLPSFGVAIADAGDVDGDGRCDLLIGASGCQDVCDTPGRVMVIGGGTHEILLSVDGLSYDGGFGSSLDAIGDVDGDGVPDFVVGAPFDSTSGPGCGRVTLVSGQTGARRLTVLGDQAAVRFGRGVVGLGDVDDDGLPDVLVGKVPTAMAPGFARVHSGGRPALEIGRTVVGGLLAQPSSPDVDEVHFHGVAGMKLKVRAWGMSGDLEPRVDLLDQDDHLVAKLVFDVKGGTPSTEKVKLTETGTYRLRVRGRKLGDQPTTGDYRIETDASFAKKAGSFTAKRAAKPGETMVVKMSALPGATLDATVLLRKGYDAPPAILLRAPDGATLEVAAYAAFDDDAVHLDGVPLLQLGTYRIEVEAAPTGKSKVKVHVQLTQPAVAGELPLP